ncbi:MAG TPA: hypothetical protein DD435_14925 [Cyanobacteria bacterium UBA8530]|nr:hypothetical protein [Cyanobacteria bacterium UBA8530]
MSKRIEPKRKTPLEILRDLRDGHQEASGQGPVEAQRYLEKVLSSQHSLPNAVKFFAYDFLVEASYLAGEAERCLEAIAAAQRYLPSAQEETGREIQDYLPELRFCERGIGLLADSGEIEQALALCDQALELGLGRAYESKRQSLERRL